LNDSKLCRVSQPENYPVANNSSNLVIAVQSCHWFNIDTFYKEVDRVLISGGTVAVAGYDVPFIELPGQPELTDKLNEPFMKVSFIFLYSFEGKQLSGSETWIQRINKGKELLPNTRVNFVHISDD
jgi:ubiquinone/menaquinone biosynthesis C-methylase UbiE